MASAEGADPAPLPPLVAAFLEHLAKERDVSPNTVKAYTRDLGELCGFLGPYYGTATWEWGTVDRLAMRAFLAHLQKRSLSKRSMARALSAVRTFYAWLHRNDLVEDNPARSVGTPKLERHLPGHLDRAQVQVLFDALATRARSGRFNDVRDLAIVELFYSAGLRVSELRGVNRADLDLLAGLVKVRGKGRKERIVPMGGPAQAALQKYLTELRPALIGVKSKRPTRLLAVVSLWSTRVTTDSSRLTAVSDASGAAAMNPARAQPSEI